ncbi:MAG: L-threonylcarbamoyladenylate synthase [Candidatus Micrarchaeota archaeon]|nr:L-threonylcarbamoyladenylate synthase [Candidatus Micrarchaeota archaeon]
MKTEMLKISKTNPEISKIRKASAIIRKGGLVAFPTETVYGLGADALNPKAVKKIFRAKGRPSDNPLIVHIARKNDIYRLAKEVPKSAEKLMREFWPGPLTIVLKKSKAVPKIITAGLNTVAIRMPSNKIALKLIKESGVPIAAPSANSSTKPSPTSVASDIPTLLRPGGISLEKLRECLGKVDVHPVAKGNKAKESLAKSPGMKYRHYSPKAEVILVEGKGKMQKIREIAKSWEIKGKKVAIMKMGNDHGRIAKKLFSTFRELDRKGFDAIIIEGTDEKGLGLAVMNRIRKAASRKIKV